MLRRIFDGLLIALVAWFALARLDAGALAIGIALAAAFVFTAWRIHKLWKRYKHLLTRLAEARELEASDDATERERGARMLRDRELMRAAEMGLWSGFIMGAAASAGHAAPLDGGGDGGWYDGGAGHDGGGSYGGDMGGFGGGFDGGGGM